MRCVVCTCRGAWELARRVCVDASVCVWVACVHDSLDTGPNVWESHSCWGGLGAGSPQCYSSCQLWFPSPLISALLPSLPLMPSQCFPFRLLLCFPSITADGSMRRETNRGEARRRERPGVAAWAVSWGSSCFHAASRWPSCFQCSDWPLALNCRLLGVIYMCLNVSN